MTKILFVCKKRLDDYGYSFGLFNSAKFIANYLNSKGIEAKAIMSVDNNAIDKDITEYNPTHVVIEAIWITPDKFRQLLSLRRHRGRKWVVRIHSKIPFIANEGIAFTWLKEYVKIAKEFDNFVVAPNNKKVARDLKEVIDLRTIYLPNIYWPMKCSFTTYIGDKEYIDIGCFGAIRPMKNQLNQAVAAIRFANRIGKKLRFHINGNRREQKGEQVLKNLEALFDGTNGQHELVAHQWVPHDKFLDLIKEMDMGLQVSMSETFNIVAADFIVSGVPIIGSPEIEWLPQIFKADPNSSGDILFILMFVNKIRKWKLHYLSNIYLYFYNIFAKRSWIKFLCD